MASQIVRKLLRATRTKEVFSNPNLPRVFDRNFTAAAASDSSNSNLIRATLFPGDGIGPEIAESVKEVLFQP